MNAEAVIGDVYATLDEVVALHSDRTAFNDESALAREVVLRARHLKSCVSKWVVEMIFPALTSPEAEAAVQAQREELEAGITGYAITPETHRLLDEVVRALSGKRFGMGKLNQWFLAPPHIIWPHLPPDYYAIVRHPMDLQVRRAMPRLRAS